MRSALRARRSRPADVPWFLRLYGAELFHAYRWWTAPVDFAEALGAFLRLGWVVEIDGCRSGFGLADPDPRGSIVLHMLAGRDLRGAGNPPGTGSDGRTDWHAWIPDSWYASGMAVEPEHRRRGVARALAEIRTRAAQEAGARALFVACLLGSGTEQLYVQLGFEEIGDYPDFYEDGSTVRLMVRRFGAAAPAAPVYRLRLLERLRLAWYARPLLVALFMLGLLGLVICGVLAAA